ncbi:MAG: BlaI/MecI/CopY family transcriptional regulator, partial [Chloroflexi bacterium]|nr:BlaI/MecI/CopY family transcriptional regulator [Chloroflexota bacterium]
RMGPVTVAEVYGRIAEREPIAYTTVMTIMGRLVSKGILTRERRGGSYVYSAAISKEEMVQSLVRNVLDRLLREFAEPTVAYFMRRLAEDEDALEEVERIIAQHKSQQPR